MDNLVGLAFLSGSGCPSMVSRCSLRTQETPPSVKCAQYWLHQGNYPEECPGPG